MSPPRQRKVRKAIAIASHEQDSRWPYPWEDIDEHWALEAIHHGNGSILAGYFRQNDNLAPRVGRLLADVLRPTSSHWRLDVEYRYFGAPTKRAIALRSDVVAALQPLANRISGSLTIDTNSSRACRYA